MEIIGRAMSKINEILSGVTSLNANEKLQLIDKVLASIYPSNKGVDKEWENESEERIRSYEKGLLPTLDESAVLEKYKK